MGTQGCIRFTGLGVQHVRIDGCAGIESRVWKDVF